MTKAEFTRQLPIVAGDELGVQPPLIFNGVSARVFPLRANLDTLQELCNAYLNFVPREAGYFRVPLPYVLLTVLNYGEMGELVMRTGWFSQIEVYFGIPVEWYKLVHGRWVFHDWAVITPYIFVTDDVSVPIGRTVYGFPKVLATVEQTQSGWTKDPVAPVTLARVATTVFPEAYSGGNLETRVFLEIERSTVSNLRVPFDTSSPFLPWQIVSNLAKAAADVGRDAMWMAQAQRIFPLSPLADPSLFREMIGKMGPWMAPGGPGFIVNSLNLKQFRHCDDPSRICYQSLTNGTMRTTGFNGFGLMGESRVMVGDFSGGHSIQLYEHSSLPIARTLGLVPHRTWKNAGVQVSEYKPVMPFWADIDLLYEAGTNLAQRSSDGIWKDETGTPFDPAQKPLSNKTGPPFNNAVSTAIEAISGPFQFAGSTIRVIPLLAKKHVLQQYLDSSLNLPLSAPVVHEDGTPAEQVRFELWARPPQCINPDQFNGGKDSTPVGGDTAFVYLTASSFTTVTSKTNNVGDWAKDELAFMIPVKFQRNRGLGWETAGVGMVPAFSFTDNDITAISRLEIQGIQMATANFVRPETVWLGQEGLGDPGQTVLRVEAELLAVLGAGQKAAVQPVIEICRDTSGGGLGDAPDWPWKWAEHLRRELDTKKASKLQNFRQLKIARALSLELLGNHQPFSLYTLKQFRDVTDPDRACYQSLVRVPRVLTEVFDVREIEETLTVRISDYPSLNIVEVLGIHATRLSESTSGIVYNAQGIRPFYIRATMDEPLAERLLSRSAAKQWTIFEPAFQTLLSGDPKAPGFDVDLHSETLQDQTDPSRTVEALSKARQRRETRDTGSITALIARSALDTIDPQMVIESILSREWCNTDPKARWRKGKRDLVKGFNALPSGGTTKPFTEAELYRQINNLYASRPGAVAARIAPQDMTFLLQVFKGLNNYFADPKLSVADFIKSVTAIPATSGENISDQQVLAENLRGGGDALRWRTQLTSIFKSQSIFTGLRLVLEKRIDSLSPVAILGLTGIDEAYRLLNQTLPADQQLPIPDANKVLIEGETLIRAIDAIQSMSVVGEPSADNSLDTESFANLQRLRELLRMVVGEIQATTPGDDSAAAKLQVATTHLAQEGEMVDLARRYCDVQFQALLNKLSRAYQRPDFCLRRDAFVAASRDSFLPLSLSWDEDWYYGGEIRLMSGLESLIPARAAAGTPQSREESPLTGVP